VQDYPLVTHNSSDFQSIPGLYDYHAALPGFSSSLLRGAVPTLRGHERDLSPSSGLRSQRLSNRRSTKKYPTLSVIASSGSE